MASLKTPPPQVAALLKTLPPDTRDLAAQTRTLMLRTIPGLGETPDTKARIIGYGFGPGYKGLVATLILSNRGVKIGLPFAATWPDPEGLLAGTGRVHRHIAITHATDLKPPAVRALLRRALAAWRERAGLAG